jgi:adenylylsulfate kinase
VPRVLMAGLPGTGKSTLAAALAEPLGGLILNKDSIREAVFGPRFVEYSAAQDGFVLELMLHAAEWVESRNPAAWIFFDGRTFSRRRQREQVMAEKVILCHCPEETARRRLAEPGGHPARNRDFALYQRVREQFEPIEGPYWAADTTLPIGALTADGLRYLKG